MVSCLQVSYFPPVYSMDGLFSDVWEARPSALFDKNSYRTRYALNGTVCVKMIGMTVRVGCFER